MRNASATSSEKYSMEVSPPLRVTTKLLSSKFISLRLSPTHSLIRMPVPKNSDSIASSRTAVLL